MSNPSKMKVYQEVLNEIRRFIQERELEDGDRIPSERELSDQLNASRASVREALRAIELLGLIETRHGEGTFLRTYKPFHSVELLSTFVLTEAQTKDELKEVQYMLEQLCLQELKRLNVREIEELESLDGASEQIHNELFILLFNQLGNQLLLKIWHLVAGFQQMTEQEQLDASDVQSIIDRIKRQEYDQAIDTHSRLYT
ncbi:FadR/GntR family transcriptional regulator [Alkalibacillus almallahensis]|uniref:FadR/GntR family transcriptional regulator n=1 Tax=Alkalibacillus almallahensis TaxID=1379154 RepID=UPI001423B712|nr:GntR family transcriptional regulator [Alkalibacillus almallahensis]NIK11078.1 DNA-binding FadR family transcriptional regulator [Alkalibacillus almallahensis]